MTKAKIYIFLLIIILTISTLFAQSMDSCFVVASIEGCPGKTLPGSKDKSRRDHSRWFGDYRRSQVRGRL